MKKYKGFVLMFFDLLIVNINFVLTVFVRFDFNFYFDRIEEPIEILFITITLVYLLAFSVAKTNRSIWDRIGVDEGLRIFVANLIATSILISFKYVGFLAGLPGSIIVLLFFINTLFQEITRFSYRMFRTLVLRRNKIKREGSKRLLIYGAGNAGALIANEITNSPDFNSYVIGFIDDNPYLKGKFVAGHIVYGNHSILEKIIDEHSVDEIIVAMPSETLENQKEALSRVYKTGFPVKTVTSSEVLMTSNSLKNSLKEVDILDLLQRKEIILDDEEIRNSIEGQSILVTGGAGSIGSELVRQILKHNPSEITILDINENSLYSLQQEIIRKTREGLISESIKVNAYIASIRDYKNLEWIFSTHNFNLVFHAAAHKHVPLMEESPQEAIKNNIFGTRNLIECCNKFKVDRFINISTDKAVNPTNVMGATKRFNEMMLQSQTNTHTKFVAVRFGNVLGSNGSVVPLFKKQIKNGGPVTVTHPDITRYFMTIPEAVSLVLQAETYAKGGEIFVLDMGEPVKILDLAENIIKLTGYKPYVDIKIEFSGLRPGEKLYEELLMAEEGLVNTRNKMIFIAKPIVVEASKINEYLSVFRDVVENSHDRERIILALKNAVPTYKVEGE